jgi:hypothetical protein
MNIIDPNFISSLKSEIQKQLDANGGPVTRKTVLAALDTKLDAEQLKDAELAISLAFRLGCVPEYNMYQKIGIKPADYVPTKKRSKPAKEPKANTTTSPRQLHPKVAARVAAQNDAEVETTDSDSDTVAE